MTCRVQASPPREEPITCKPPYWHVWRCGNPTCDCGEREYTTVPEMFGERK